MSASCWELDERTIDERHCRNSKNRSNYNMNRKLLEIVSHLDLTTALLGHLSAMPAHLQTAIMF